MTPVAVIKSVPFWTEPGTWATIERGRHALTSFYLLSAVDLRWNADGSIERVPPEQAIFLRVFARTFLVAATVTLATLILGFPLAYLISSVPKTVGAILIVVVLLPFWTSILVRTAAWTVLLQKFGLVNDVLLWLGVTGTKLDLMYSRRWAHHRHDPHPVAVHATADLQRHAHHPAVADAGSVFPRRQAGDIILARLSSAGGAGIMAGCLLTFILCLGYYITPALIGGAGDQLISNFIANYVNVELNWEMAAALSFILLVFTMGLYAVFARSARSRSLEAGVIMLLSPYPTIGEPNTGYAVVVWGALVIAFLMVPILMPVPLSFNSGAFFVFPLEGLSTRWYEVVLGTDRWQTAIGNSLIIAFGTTRPRHSARDVDGDRACRARRFPARRIIMPLVISPLIVPVVITAVGSYLFYARVGLASTYAGIILAHTALASPFVVVTVRASLTGFDRNLMRAASIAGAKPVVAFYRVMLPLILPGVLSGAAFAFVTSFDEVVVAQFLASANQRTMPLEMFIGLRERLSPAITAAATLMMLLSIILLVVANLLARRGQRRPSISA